MKNSLFAIFILINAYAAYKLFPPVTILSLNLALGGFVLLLLIISRFDIAYMVLMWFFFLLFSKSTKLSIPVLPDISVERLIWILIFFSLLADSFLGRTKRNVSITFVEVAMLAFIVYVFSSMVIYGTFYSAEEGSRIGPLLAGYVFPFSMFIISQYIINDEEKIKKLFVCFSLIGFYLGLTGIFEYFQLRELVFPSFIMNSWEGIHWGRARGPFLNAAVNGAVVGMISIMSIHLILHEKVKWKKIFYFISLLCSLTTLVFSMTRGCWLAFSIAIIVVSVFIPRVRNIVLPGIVVLAILFSLLAYSGKVKEVKTFSHQFQYKSEGTIIERIFLRTGTSKTVTGRFDLYRLGWAMFLERPFFGYGYGTFKEAKRNYILRNEMLVSDDLFIQVNAMFHDTYMGILIDLGLLGLGLYLFIVFYVLNVCRRLYIKLPQEGFLGKDFAVISFGIFLVLLIKIQSSDLRYFIFPNSVFFSLAGIVVGLNRRISQRNNISPADRKI